MTDKLWIEEVGNQVVLACPMWTVNLAPVRSKKTGWKLDEVMGVRRLVAYPWRYKMLCDKKMFKQVKKTVAAILQTEHERLCEKVSMMDLETLAGVLGDHAYEVEGVSLEDLRSEVVWAIENGDVKESDLPS